jgi:crotonobetainyl-CoA:carnitine CoA-transferase CaiB-like acyl-CoA transferase
MDELGGRSGRGPSGAHPLAGVRVIDLTTNMSGPLATQVLADQGADVIKVEPPAGDLIRTVGTGRAGMSAYFANLNRGKRSIAVDIAVPAGRQLVERLSSTADVFVQNFRMGVAERLGLGPDVVCAANPRLVYTSISGFGPTGPLAAAPAYDHVVQALSGFAALQSEGREPALVRQGVVDKATAYSTAQAVTAALLARATTGRGAHVDVSMLDVAVAFIWPDGMMNHTCADPDEVLPPVSRSFRVTPTADGHVSLVTLTARQWGALVDAILDGEAERPDLTATGARMTAGGAIMRRVRAKLATLPTAEVVERLAAADVPCAPVVALDAVPAHPQVAASGAVLAVDHTVLGAVHQARPAPRFDGVPSPVPPWAPRLGEHTDQILREAGLQEAEITELRTAGTVG